MSNNKKTIKVGTISGNDILLNRKGKLNRNDDVVKMGSGVHIPKEFKEKARQKDRNSLRELYK